MIIGLTGLAGSGKNTVADMIATSPVNEQLACKDGNAKGEDLSTTVYGFGESVRASH